MTSVTASGGESATVTSRAADGPTLRIWICQLIWLPASTEAGPVLVTWRSADSPTEPVAVETLLAATGSAVSALTRAVLVTVAPRL